MEANNPSIRSWPAGDHPRAKLFQMRSYDLSTAELLAMIIGPGNAKCNGVELASRVLAACDNSLSNLTKSSIRDLMQVPGIGRAKASALIAFSELSRRRQAEEALQKTRINNSRDAFNFLAPLLRDLTYMIYGALFLSQNGNLIKFEILFEGGITSATFDIRIVFQKALMHRAVSVILCHNRVSALARPGKREDTLIERLLAASKLMDIRLMDYIVIGENDYYSYGDDGMLY
jgi:DNA repair protein RadC